MPSDVFVILLRGVNVNGITVRSDALRECLAGIAGVEAAATVLASGNAVIRTALAPERLKTDAEAALRTAFGYDAWVVVVRRDELASLADRCPWPEDDPDVHAYLTFWSDGDLHAEAAAAASEAGWVHEVLSRTALAWPCRRASSTDDPLAKLLARRRYQPVSTTRNLRTLRKVVATTI